MGLINVGGGGRLFPKTVSRTTVYMCEFVHISTSAWGSQKRVTNFLGLELQVVVR